jgi:predicted ATPase
MPQIENKKIVISGGSGSGKTTLVNLLRNKGYNCFDEYSRTLIQSTQKKGVNNIFKSQPLSFSEKVWEGRLEQYNKYRYSLGSAQKSYVFFDRGLHDVIAYLECIGASFDSKKLDLSNYTYNMALLLPPWKAIYIEDNERKEGFEKPEKLYFYIKNTYQKNNIPIVEIPFLTPELRILTLLNYLDDEKNA